MVQRDRLYSIYIDIAENNFFGRFTMCTLNIHNWSRKQVAKANEIVVLKAT